MISNYKLQELYLLAQRFCVAPSNVIIELCRELAKARGITLYDTDIVKSKSERRQNERHQDF